MKKKILFILICLVAMLLLAVSAFAASGYDLSWWTVDGGGGTSTGSNGYTLNGTIGQPDAGTLSSGGVYTLTGGFWHGGVVASSETKVYLPLLVK
jgi:hypothetical protein